MKSLGGIETCINSARKTGAERKRIENSPKKETKTKAVRSKRSRKKQKQSEAGRSGKTQSKAVRSRWAISDIFLPLPSAVFHATSCAISSAHSIRPLLRVFSSDSDALSAPATPLILEGDGTRWAGLCGAGWLGPIEAAIATALLPPLPGMVCEPTKISGVGGSLSVGVSSPEPNPPARSSSMRRSRSELIPQPNTRPQKEAQVAWMMRACRTCTWDGWAHWRR